MNVELLTITPDAEKHIEACGRTCYKSFDKITDNSAGRFIQMLVKAGHESVIEHGVATFRISGVSRALTHQLVRHRVASFSQESQRYVAINTPKRKTPWSKFTEEEENSICELYKKGDSTGEIGRFFGCSPQTISNIIVRNGGVLRDVGEYACVDSDIFNPDSLTPIEAQLLGTIASDGNVFISESKGVSRITIKMKDKKYIEQIAYMFNSVARAAEKDLYVTTLNSKKVCDRLINTYGIVPNKSLIMTHDLIDKNLPKHMISHYIRGYLEGDGSILWYPEHHKRMIVFTSGNINSLEWINKQICEFCGIALKKIYDKEKAFQLQYQGKEDINKILLWLYSDFEFDFILDRKLYKAVELCPDLYNQIEKSCTLFSSKYKVVIPPSIIGELDLLLRYTEIMYKSLNLYNELEHKIKNEDRRFVLPNACETEIVITANFREWRHILQERMASGAQWEIKQLMLSILLHLKRHAPNVFADFEV